MSRETPLRTTKWRRVPPEVRVPQVESQCLSHGCECHGASVRPSAAYIHTTRALMITASTLALLAVVLLLMSLPCISLGEPPKAKSRCAVRGGLCFLFVGKRGEGTKTQRDTHTQDTPAEYTTRTHKEYTHSNTRTLTHTHTHTLTHRHTDLNTHTHTHTYSNYSHKHMHRHTN